MRSHRLATTPRLCSTISTVRLSVKRFDQRADAGDVIVAHAEPSARRAAAFAGSSAERRRDFQNALPAIGRVRPPANPRTDASPTSPISAVAAIVERPQHPLGAARNRTSRRAGVVAARCARFRAPVRWGKHRRDLKRAHQPRRRATSAGFERGDVAARRTRCARASGCKNLLERLKQVGLAGAVRADQRVDAAARDAQVDRAHRDEAAELLRQVLGFEDDLNYAPRSPKRRPLSSVFHWQAVKWNTAGA